MASIANLAHIQQMTPVEIDTILSGIWSKQQTVEMLIAGYRKSEETTKARIQKIKRGEHVPGYYTLVHGIELMEQLNLVRDNIDLAKADLAKYEAEALPFENEYVRRGGWTRVFLAQSHDGHAHRGQNCSTCHHGEFRTSFAWLTRYSGKPEAEIVADAGERACTTCYPTAPVNVLKQRTKMFTPDEEEAARRRDERAIKAAAKKADADAKSITTPEGGKLYAGKYNDSYDVCKTLRTAEIAATDALADLIVTQRQAKDPEFSFLFENGWTEAKRTMEIARHAWCLIRSIAAKKGLTFQEVFETHEKKAQAKVCKNDREWAKDFRNPNRVK